MLLIFMGVCDKTIVLSWLNFESSIHMPFENLLHCEKHLNMTCLLEVQNLVMRLYFDVTFVDLNDVFDLTIDLSWLSFESSIHMSFENILHRDKHLILTCILQVQNLVMRLHFDVTSVEWNTVGRFCQCLWHTNILSMTEFWKCNTWVVSGFIFVHVSS